MPGYTGYARSEGTPSEENVYADVDAIWSYLTKTRGLAPDQIVFYSRYPPSQILVLVIGQS